MRKFASICKKKLKETLTPYGYKSWKRAFLKMEKDVFFLIDMRGHYSFYGSGISTVIGVEPYCSNALWDESELREPVGHNDGNLFRLLNKIDPKRFTMEYVRLLTLAQDDEGMLERLDIICDILKEYVMPYMENYKDLEFYYNERLASSNSRRKIISPYATEDMFGMSIKLKKYENAIHYPNHMMPLLSERMDADRAYFEEVMGENWREILRQKKDKNSIYAEKQYAEAEKEFNDLKSAKEALLSKDYEYLDLYIEGVEERSRAHHESLLRGK